MAKTITAIIVSYDRPQGVIDVLEMINQQTISVEDIILVHDGSTDKDLDNQYEAIAHKYQCKYIYVEPLFSQEGIKLFNHNGAANKALPYVITDAVWWVSDDYVFAQNVVELFHYYYDHPQYPIALTGNVIHVMHGKQKYASREAAMSCYRETGKLEGAFAYAPHINKGLWFVQNCVGMASDFSFVPTEIAAWTSETMGFMGEVDYCCKLKVAGVSIYVISEMVVYHIRPPRMTAIKQRSSLKESIGLLLQRYADKLPIADWLMPYVKEFKDDPNLDVQSLEQWRNKF